MEVAFGLLLEDLAAVGAYEVGFWYLDTPTPGLPAVLGVTVTTGFVFKGPVAFWTCDLVSVRDILDQVLGFLITGVDGHGLVVGAASFPLPPTDMTGFRMLKQQDLARESFVTV